MVFLSIWQLLRLIFYEMSKVTVLTASMLKWPVQLLVKINFYISKFDTFSTQPFSFTGILTTCDSFSVKVTLLSDVKTDFDNFFFVKPGNFWQRCQTVRTHLKPMSAVVNWLKWQHMRSRSVLIFMVFDCLPTFWSWKLIRINANSPVSKFPWNLIIFQLFGIENWLKWLQVVQ